jgi:hypothetical protein
MINFDAYLEPPDDNALYEECQDCDGTGKLADEDNVGKVIGCYTCEGTGETEVEECGSCGYTPCHCDAIYDNWKDNQND